MYSVLLVFDNRVEFLELDARLLIGKLPLDGGVPRVALGFQRPNPLLQCLHVGRRSGKTAALESTHLDVQSAAKPDRRCQESAVHS